MHARCGRLTIAPPRNPSSAAARSPSPVRSRWRIMGSSFSTNSPEFSRYVLETPRQPLEGGEVTIARVHGSIKFPARFMLVAATNPTASGYAPVDPRARDKYLGKLSGPLL